MRWSGGPGIPRQEGEVVADDVWSRLAAAAPGEAVAVSAAEFIEVTSARILAEPVSRQGVRHAEALASFVAYCEGHPAERFWQALRNWSNARYPDKRINFIMTAASDAASDLAEDTFHWED